MSISSAFLFIFVEKNKLFYCKYLNINNSFDVGEDEHAAYLMGWMVDKVCDAYHKIKKEEEK